MEPAAAGPILNHGATRVGKSSAMPESSSRGSGQFTRRAPAELFFTPFMLTERSPACAGLAGTQLSTLTPLESAWADVDIPGRAKLATRADRERLDFI